MPSREEIREGIAKVLYTFEYDGWDKLSEGDRVMWLTRADAVMNKESSQGVVIRGQTLGASHPHLVDYFTVEPLI